MIAAVLGCSVVMVTRHGLPGWYKKLFYNSSSKSPWQSENFYNNLSQSADEKKNKQVKEYRWSKLFRLLGSNGHSNL